MCLHHRVVLAGNISDFFCVRAYINHNRNDKNNVNNEIECEKDTKPTVYIGETSRNIYTRGGEHLRMREDIDSFINRHMKERHEGEDDNFVAKVTHSNKDCLTRQVREGVLIRRYEREVMNSRTEWFQPPLFRIRTEIENS